MRHARRLLFSLLAAMLLAPAATALAQGTVTETQGFTLHVPPARAATAPTPPSPSPSNTPSVAVPNHSLAQPAAAPLPRRLAYTGTDPMTPIAAGAALIALSLLARRWTRARLRARAGA